MSVSLLAVMVLTSFHADIANSACDSICGCGYRFTNLNVDGEGKEWSNPGQGIENCAAACSARRGCTAFEYNFRGDAGYACGTYTGGHNNLANVRTGHGLKWQTCVATNAPEISTHCDIADGLYEIYVQGGMEPDRNKRLLSATSSGKVHMFPFNERTGRHEWEVERQPDGYYHIKIAGGVSSGGKYLTVSTSGKNGFLHPFDDASGRQRWMISAIPGNKEACHITIMGGIKASGKDKYRGPYLSTPPHGKYVHVWYQDDNSGRQQWIFKPE